MNEIYDIDEPVKLNAFGSVRSYRAKVHQRDPLEFITGNGVIVKRDEVVSVERVISCRVYLADCEVIRGPNSAAWTAENRRFSFMTPTGLDDLELSVRARAAMLKRWKTSVFTKLVSRG